MAKKSVKSVNQLNKALSALVLRIERSEEFVVQQAPLVCREIIKEAVMKDIVDLLMYALALCVMVPLDYQAYLNTSTHTEEWWLAVGVLSMFAVVTLGCTFETTKELLTIKYCPKLFTLRALRRLLK